MKRLDEIPADAEERLRLVAGILAGAMLRMRLRSSGKPREARELSLDLARDRSPHAVVPSRDGETTG